MGRHQIDPFTAARIRAAEEAGRAVHAELAVLVQCLWHRAPELPLASSMVLRECTETCAQLLGTPIREGDGAAVKEREFLEERWHRFKDLMQRRFPEAFGRMAEQVEALEDPIRVASGMPVRIKLCADCHEALPDCWCVDEEVSDEGESDPTEGPTALRSMTPEEERENFLGSVFGDEDDDEPF